MNLYNRIEKLCFDHGINITDMCKETGASRGSLGDLKSNKKKNLPVDTLLKISNYFGITINELISSGNNRIRAARRYRKKSSADMAKILGIDLATYNHYESTRYAPTHILTSLSEMLDIDLDFISGTEYILDNPISSWSEDIREDYVAADEDIKSYMEYQNGKIRYIKSNISPISTNDDYEKELLRLFRLCNITNRLEVINQLTAIVKQEEEKKNAPSISRNA